MTPEILVAIGGVIIIVNAGTQIGVKIIIDRLLKNGNNGFCKEHIKVMGKLETLIETHKEENQVEILTKALTQVLKNNNK